MSDLKLDPVTWDIVIENGDLQIYDVNIKEDKEELARQVVLLSLRTFRGEWYKNINFGVPYLENDNNPIQLYGSKNKVFFDSFIKQAVLENNEIKEIISYNSTLEPVTGLLTIDMVVGIEDGEVEITTTV